MRVLAILGWQCVRFLGGVGLLAMKRMKWLKWIYGRIARSGVARVAASEGFFATFVFAFFEAEVSLVLGGVGGLW